ncbi:hypothetical protein CI109_104783 [Kwoniella shandongensis]|uniref:GST C-terminal domain-containing protein n=1 Tax=Kwoniella shandongensis TaxID=1734106 RepID=A0AAJ8MYR6_9TREE
MTDEELPKAILYSWPTSVWSTVPRLCLYEKGYSEDEYVVRYVDISTIPTLVVPTIETTGSGVDTRYRSLRDTVTICDFLDQARSASSGHLHSEKPAPTLAPATIEGKALSDNIIAVIHQTTVDPNFVALSARDKKELADKGADGPGRALTLRRAALRRYLEEAKQAASENSIAPKDGGLSYEQKVVKFIEDKLQSNEHIWALYNGQAGEENEKAFFDISTKTWLEALPEAFSKLESTIKGPYALGDQVSLADLHAISWLTRLVSIAGGKPDASGLDTLEPYVGKDTLGPKLRKFWDVWVDRESFKKVLVPATAAFAEMR